MIAPDEQAKLFISDFAEILRDLMRALAADDTTRAISSASRMMRIFEHNLKDAPESLNWYKIFDGAICKLKPSPLLDDFDNQYVRLARRSVKLLAEMTTDDGFSAARFSAARKAVQEEVRRLT